MMGWAAGNGAAAGASQGEAGWLCSRGSEPMSKTLLVMRHAKSSWKDASLSDHDRPLNKRGRTAAPRMGELIRDQGILPDYIATSSALRARATAEAVADACGYSGTIRELCELYLAPPAAYVQAVRGIDTDLGRVLVVGHNPGITQLVCELARADEVMPTGALALIELPIRRWADLDFGVSGQLMRLWRPRELD